MSAPWHVYAFLVIGLIAASQSGNLIRIGDAHPVAIAAWRLIMASVLLFPVAYKDLRVFLNMKKRDLFFVGLTGIVLACHFFFWIAAVQNAPVANAAVFFSINPVITATFGFLFFKEVITKRLVASILLGLTGVVFIGFSELSFSPEHLLGDFYALVCSFLFTAYFLLGKRLRRIMPTGLYVFSVYATAALFSFAVLAFIKEPIFHYSARNWLCFALMALLPTLLGHTSFNHAVRYIDASRISASTVVEPLLAGIVAAFAWNEPFGRDVVVGYAIITLSVIVLLSDRLKPVPKNRKKPIT